MTSQHPQGETRRRAQTRRRLMTAAREIFLEQSIRETPVELICERAGFSRGAFYSNFDTKDDLFLAVYDEELTGQLEQARAAVNDAIDTRARDEESLTHAAVAIGTACAESLIADRNWYLLVTEFRVHAMRNPELRARAAGYLDHFTNLVGDMLLSALDRLGMVLTVDTQDAVHLLSAVYEAELQRAAFHEANAPSAGFLGEILPRMVSSLTEKK